MAAQSFDRTSNAAAGGRNTQTRHSAGNDATFAGGVHWLGVEHGNQIIEGAPAGGKKPVGQTTVVLGSTHGPRLLELVSAPAA
ncbi:MAG: hypothetical protein ACREL7_10785 [Longimicrobiales bacterium]